MSHVIHSEIKEKSRKFRGEAYQEGFLKGSQVGVTEGKQYGAVHGGRIGSEIACYYGFVFAWKHLIQNNLDTKSSKRLKTLNLLLEMIQNFPYEDPTYAKLQEDMEKIRAKFRQVCSLLNVRPDFRNQKEGSGMTF
ncbi:protein LTO1 homolog isoform X2 [Latimeria chalumnae]|uniref:protein LTO1 homolog isoform X2 n=1 Tax=Latimeria chalumnae TaxID=7897 RepID=UPI0003C162AD|nr:PREDICTED: oral cancer-overexpressed protein 1 isoform X2 [Latimeria chalumnae]|eukprot:XP_005996283.1 PREDICTED: oral cancer-overexpressed protein 1 isoform X2 [Latimeria chalumnae]